MTPEQRMEALLTEMLVLRRQVSEAFPADGAQPPDVADALVTVRGWLDRMESIHGTCIGLHGAAKRHSRTAAQAADDSYDVVAVRLRDAARRRDSSYSTGRERQADVNLEILEQLRQQRHAQRVEDAMYEMLERVRLAYRGADAVRQDLNGRLRYLSWESHLER
jgi:hypothetical protein